MQRRWQALLMPLGRASLPCVDGAYRPAGELMPLFTPTLSCWADWSRYYQDREAFAPVVEAIHAIEGWERPERLEALTPGTNFVVKWRSGRKNLRARRSGRGSRSRTGPGGGPN